MPDLAFHSVVLSQVVDQLAASGNPTATAIKGDAALMRAATLGALGPDLLRYRPVDQSTLQALQSTLASLAGGQVSQTALMTAFLGIPTSARSDLFLNPLGTFYSMLFGQIVSTSSASVTTPGLWQSLATLNSFLAQLNEVVQNEDELGLIPLLGQVSSILSIISSLKGLSTTLSNFVPLIAMVMALGPTMETDQLSPLAATILSGAPSAVSPAGDRLYEFLAWHGPGRFAEMLFKLADGSNDPTQIAFAFGWLCHYGASVTAQPFVNNITAGPYRTHWWRSRLVANYVDSWTFGFFKQTPLPTQTDIDDFAPSYDGWPLITQANLQDSINVGGLADPAPGNVPDALNHMGWGDIAGLRALPGQLPTSIANLLVEAVKQTYTGALPAPPAALTDPQTYADAFTGSFAVFWFLTSGAGPFAATLSTAVPPCPEPSWIQNVVNGGGSPPSPQQAGLNEGATVFDIVLAILALLALLFGDAGTALALITAALSISVIDWPTAQCNMFWLLDIVENAELALQDFFALTAIGYPPSFQLGKTTVNAQNQSITQPATDFSGNPQLPALLQSLSSGGGGQSALTSLAQLMPATAGVPLCRTGPLGGVFKPEAPYPFGLDQRSSIAAVADLNYFWSPGISTTVPPAAPDVAPVETTTTNGLLLANPQAVLYPKDIIQGLGLNAGGILANVGTPSANVPFGDAVSNAAEIVADAFRSKPEPLPDLNLDGDRGYGWRTWNANADPALTSPVATTPEA